MKAPSKNITASLKGQRPPGRGSEPVSTGKLTRYGPSMTVPGDGMTDKAPGTGTRSDGRQERSASVYADALGRRVGG